MSSILLLDNLSNESIMLLDSFKAANFKGKVVVVDDDGFLPSGVISLYRYFCGHYKDGKPRYFNQINIPDYWEIDANNNSGKIMNLFRKRGSIFYTNPTSNRLVSTVDWYDEEGIVRSSDHYDKNGFLYARTTFDKLGHRFCKSYYDQENREVIVENYVTRDIILNYDGKTFVYKNKIDFAKKLFALLDIKCDQIFYNSLSTPFFISEALDKSDKNDILFWQENPRSDIPGNMQIILDGNSKRTNLIYVQKMESFDRLIDLGANKDIVKPLGFVYNFVKNNKHSNNVLICTNSDQIEQLEFLVNNLRDVNFHIGAITEMSSKLLSMTKYDNVFLYPGASISLFEELFNKCDIYLDINHGNEILDSVKKAFLHNQLILGFSNTLHNRLYICKEHVCDSGDKMVKLLGSVLTNRELLNSELALQKKAALSEDINVYKNIFK